MSKPLSNSQIANLGNRLRAGVHSADDLALLSDYRASFAPALAEVMSAIASLTAIEPTERPEKSNQSIIYKLQRMPSSQLDRMQDIAGCRLVVGHLFEQQLDAQRLVSRFPDSKIHSLLEHPHSGYRAVHVVVRTNGRRVEVQIRTLLQDLWAQCSEHWAFKVDRRIKYGQGPVGIQQALSRFSDVIYELECDWNGLQLKWIESLFGNGRANEDQLPRPDDSARQAALIDQKRAIESLLHSFKHEAEQYDPPEEA